MPSTSRLIRPLVTIVGGAAFVLGGPASAAFAHIHPDPGEIPTGTPSAVSFTLEHGCEGSPTVKVELKIPDGFTDVTAGPIDGWTSAIAGDVVTWEGGPLDAETEGAFAVTLTATNPGEFEMPIVQTCEVGSLAWIEAEIDGQPEPEHPAPVLTVADDPSAVEEHGHDEAATDETSDAGHDEAATDTTAAVVIAPAPAGDSSDDGSSNTGPIVGGVVAAIVVLGGGGYALTRKRRSPAR